MFKTYECDLNEGYKWENQKLCKLGKMFVNVCYAEDCNGKILTAHETLKLLNVFNFRHLLMPRHQIFVSFPHQHKGFCVRISFICLKTFCFVSQAISFFRMKAERWKERERKRMRQRAFNGEMQAKLKMHWMVLQQCCMGMSAVPYVSMWLWLYVCQFMASFQMKRYAPCAFALLHTITLIIIILHKLLCRR